MEYILPILMIIESFIASIIFFYSKKYGSAIYWLSSGFLILAATFLIRKFG